MEEVLGLNRAVFDCITLSKIIRKIFVPEVQVVVKFKVSSVDPALEVALCELHFRRIDGGHRESPVMRAVAESNRVPEEGQCEILEKGSEV